MLKAISDKILSLLPNHTNNIDNVSFGRKRKLCNHECDFGSSDLDERINSGRKKRRTELSDTTFVGSLKSTVSNMAQWLRPKSKPFSEEFSSVPKEASSVRDGPSTSNSNGDHLSTASLLAGRYSVNHRQGVRHSIPYQTGVSSNGNISDQIRNGIGRNISRRSSGSSFQRNKPSTASMCIRLKEKEQFQQLLRQQSLHSPWQQPITYELPATTTSAQEADVISISSNSSCDDVLHKSFSRKLGTQPDQDIYSIPKHKVTPSNNFITVRKNFLKPLQRESLMTVLCDQRRRSGLNLSYQRPSTYETYRSSADRSFLTSRVRTDHNKTSTDVIEKEKGPPPNKWSEPFIVIDDGDDDCVVTEPSQWSTTTTQPAVFRKDSSHEKAADHSFPQCIFKSRYMNDKDMEDERRATLDKQRHRKHLIEEEEMKAKAFAEKRRAQEISLDRSLKYQMRIFDDEPEVCEDIFREEKTKEEKLPELTSEMEEIIDSALRNGNPNDVLSEEFRLQITRRDIKTLSGLNWLNDEVINFYMNMLMRSGEQGERAKLYAFNTFFYPKIKAGGHSAVKRWTKNVNIFAVQFIIIPVHLGVHWCLCVADMEKKVITYYDSMGAVNNQCLNAVLQYIHDESIAKGYSGFRREEWKLVNAEDNPQQMNGGDCGMFMCMYAETITRGKDITFTQEDMPYFRRRMVYEIIRKKLLH